MTNYDGTTRVKRISTLGGGRVEIGAEIDNRPGERRECCPPAPPSVVNAVF
jgi:hypothetical protein